MSALKQSESQIELGLRAMDGKSVVQGAEKLHAPEGLAGAAENAPAVSAMWVQPDGAFVGCSAFGLMHVTASAGEMAVCGLHCEDLGPVFQSVKCLSRDIPIDGSKGVLRTSVPGH